MADLEPRVKQLEEDVAILKGEIKSVLLEVRTSLLSQSNPFANAHIAPPAAGPEVSVVPNQQQTQAQPQHQAHPQPAGRAEPQWETPHQEPAYHEQRQPQQIDNRNDFLAPVPQTDRQLAPQQQSVPHAVAPRRSWELNTLAMLLAWCQGNMVRLSDKEMSSLLSLARYGGLVDEELASILLEIAGSFDEGRVGRNATVSEYLLALHELHSVIQQEEPPAKPRLLRVS